MLIVSQNKEKVLWFGRAFNALEYSEQVDHKGKKVGYYNRKKELQSSGT